MKTHNYFIRLITFMLFICACNSNGKKEPTSTVPAGNASDSIESVGHDTIFSKEQIDTFNTLILHDPAVNSNSSIDWSRFRLSKAWVDSLRSAAFTPPKDFYAAYGPFLKYSPDSSMFIDLDSYNISIEKDQNGHWTGSGNGPDCQINLVNIRTGQKNELLFLGPGNTIDEAYWFNSEDMVLLGTHDDGNNSGIAAAIWLYSLPEKTFYLYEAKNDKALVQTMLRLSDERLKKLTMK